MWLEVPREAGCCWPGPRWAPPSLGEQGSQASSNAALLRETEGCEFFKNLHSELKDETGCEQVTIRLYVLFELKILKNVF